MRAFLLIYSIILLYVLVPVQLSAQVLSLDQLVALHNKDVDDIRDFLVEKGWKLEKSINDQYALEMKYVFYKTNNPILERWSRVNVIDFKKKEERWVTYQFYDTPTYHRLKSRISDLKMRKIKAEVIDNVIFTAFEGKNYVVVLRVTSELDDPDDITKYNVDIYPRQAYHQLN